MLKPDPYLARLKADNEVYRRAIEAVESGCVHIGGAEAAIIWWRRCIAINRTAIDRWAAKFSG